MPLPLHRTAHPDAVRLILAYPRVFGRPPLDPSYCSLMHGFLCGPGWHPVLQDLARLLDQVAREDRLEAFVVRHVAEHAGVLHIRYQLGNDRIRFLIAAAEKASMAICEDCGVPSRRQVRDGWGTTLCDACHAAYRLCATTAASRGNLPVRLSAVPTWSETPAVNPIDLAQDPGRRAMWYCDMCHAPVDRGTDFGGSWIDRHCVRSGDGALIGTFIADGDWTCGNGEVLCGECVDSLVGYLIQPAEGMAYDRRRNRSVPAEGLT